MRVWNSSKSKSTDDAANEDLGIPVCSDLQMDTANVDLDVPVFGSGHSSMSMFTEGHSKCGQARMSRPPDGHDK